MSNNTTTTQEIAGPRGGITAQKIEEKINKRKLVPVTSSGKSYSGKKSVTIENFDFTVDKPGQKQLAVTDCEEVIIQYCKFRRKTTVGQGLNITGDKTKKVTVQYCIFEDFSYDASNGGEPCRLGNSQFSGCVFECVMQYNIFRRLTADVEAISIKSCKNRIEDNFFIDNECNVTVRHGGLAIIRHNLFDGIGGVRLHGYGNDVEYNCFANNQSDGKFVPITVRAGNVNADPNWILTDEKQVISKPSGEEGENHFMYAQNVDNIIAHNEFKKCKRSIVVTADKPLKPLRTKTEHNEIVTKFTFETQGGGGSTDVPPTPPTPVPDENVPYPSRKDWFVGVLFDKQTKACLLCKQVPEPHDTTDQLLAHLITVHKITV